MSSTAYPLHSYLRLGFLEELLQLYKADTQVLSCRVMDIRPEVIKYFLGRSCTGLIVEFNDLLIPLGPHPVEESWVNSDVCTFLSEWHSNLANLIESSSDSDRSLKLATSKIGSWQGMGRMQDLDEGVDLQRRLVVFSSTPFCRA